MPQLNNEELLSFRSLAQHISHRRNITLDAALHILVSAFWLGEFGDGPDSQVARDPSQGWWSEDRQLVLGYMTKTWLPEIIQRTERSQMDDQRWQVLADMPIQDYPPDYRHQVLESLHLTRPAYEAWARRVRLPVMDEPPQPPPPRGRPNVVGLYLPEIRRRRDAGEDLKGVRDEIEYIQSWLRQEYPSAAQPSDKTIANKIYRERRNTAQK